MAFVLVEYFWLPRCSVTRQSLNCQDNSYDESRFDCSLMSEVLYYAGAWAKRLLQLAPTPHFFFIASFKSTTRSVRISPCFSSFSLEMRRDERDRPDTLLRDPTDSAGGTQ
jgi:hypothetical protein